MAASNRSTRKSAIKRPPAQPVPPPPFLADYRRLSSSDRKRVHALTALLSGRTKEVAYDALPTRRSGRAHA